MFWKPWPPCDWAVKGTCSLCVCCNIYVFVLHIGPWKQSHSFITADWTKTSRTSDQVIDLPGFGWKNLLGHDEVLSEEARTGRRLVCSCKGWGWALQTNQSRTINSWLDWIWKTVAWSPALGNEKEFLLTPFLQIKLPINWKSSRNRVFPQG